MPPCQSLLPIDTRVNTSVSFIDTNNTMEFWKVTSWMTACIFGDNSELLCCLAHMRNFIDTVHDKTVTWRPTDFVPLFTKMLPRLQHTFREHTGTRWRVRQWCADILTMVMFHANNFCYYHQANTHIFQVQETHVHCFFIYDVTHWLFRVSQLNTNNDDTRNIVTRRFVTNRRSKQRSVHAEEVSPTYGVCTRYSEMIHKRHRNQIETVMANIKQLRALSNFTRVAGVRMTCKSPLERFMQQQHACLISEWCSAAKRDLLLTFEMFVCACVLRGVCVRTKDAYWLSDDTQNPQTLLNATICALASARAPATQTRRREHAHNAEHEWLPCVRCRMEATCSCLSCEHNYCEFHFGQKCESERCELCVRHDCPEIDPMCGTHIDY